MNKLEVRWVILSIAFAFLPLALLLEPTAVPLGAHSIFSISQNPLLFFAIAQLAVMALNFVLLSAKGAAFNFYKLRSVISLLLLALALVPVFILGRYSVDFAQGFLPEAPFHFIVTIVSLIGISAMCIARAREIWTVPTLALERLARIKAEPIAS